MKYKGHDVEIVTWSDGKPWPEAITYDGVSMEYANEWESRASSQIIYYKANRDDIRRYGIDRKAFVR